MDYTEQGDSIRYVVNSSETPEEAKDRYVSLEGVLMPKDVADGVFADALAKKFPPPTKAASSILDEIKGLENSL